MMRFISALRGTLLITCPALRTSESRPEAVVVAVQQAVQDAGEDGGVVLLLV